jgi:hypothetical protein
MIPLMIRMRIVGYGRIPLAVYGMLFSLIFSLSGLHIQVEDKESQVLIVLK